MVEVFLAAVAADEMGAVAADGQQGKTTVRVRNENARRCCRLSAEIRLQLQREFLHGVEVREVLILVVQQQRRHIGAVVLRRQLEKLCDLSQGEAVQERGNRHIVLFDPLHNRHPVQITKLSASLIRQSSSSRIIVFHRSHYPTALVFSFGKYCSGNSVSPQFVPYSRQIALQQGICIVFKYSSKSSCLLRH